MLSNDLLVKTLGGQKTLGTTIHTDFDMINAVRIGFKPKVVDYVIDTNTLTRDEVEDLIIPRSTLAYRKKQHKRLTTEESDHLIRICRIAVLSIVTLGNHEKAFTWLRKPNRALQSKPRCLYSIPMKVLVWLRRC